MNRTLAMALTLAVAATPALGEVVIRPLDLGPSELEELVLRQEPHPSTTELRGTAAEGTGGPEGPFEYLVPYSTAADFAAITTLLGLVNCNPAAVAIQLHFFDPFFVLRYHLALTLQANALRTFNLRDHIADGIPLEGLVRVTSDQKILVDAMSVETAAQRASGGPALRFGRDIRAAVGGRAFQGAGLGLGTRYRLFVTAPQGADQDFDPATLIAVIFAADGTPAGAVAIWLAKHLVAVDFTELAAIIAFGGIDAKVIFLGLTAALASDLDLMLPSEDVLVGGDSIFNAGSQLNVGGNLRRVMSDF